MHVEYTPNMYVVLAYVTYESRIRSTGVERVPSIKVSSLLCDMAVASNAWRQGELLCIRYRRGLLLDHSEGERPGGRLNQVFNMEGNRVEGQRWREARFAR